MLEALTSWHWLILAVALIIGEMLGAAGFLLGAALAALLVSGLLFLGLLGGWQSQLLWFALLAVVLSFVWYAVYQRMKGKTDTPDLNDRAGQLVGRQFVLQEDLPAGQGRVQIGDTFWRVKAEGSLSAGVTVVVTDAERQVLLLKVVDTNI
ncbi:MAG: NfeD family protein [Marinobacterium sp.]|nr:NfeD family protein [Marinobacterium sp.]